MSKSPDQIVADIDRKQNEEDRDLIPRIGRKLKDAGKFLKDKVLISDTEAIKQYDDAKKNQRMEKDVVDQETQQKKMRSAIGADEIERAMREGKPVKKAKGGMIKSSASKRADGCAVKGKTRGKMV